MAVLSRWLAPVTTGASAMTAQASAGRAPAAKLAGEQPGQHHQPPPASADGSRSTTSDPGARSVISLATRGTNGG